jgi:hypothetical protein
MCIKTSRLQPCRNERRQNEVEMMAKRGAVGSMLLLACCLFAFGRGLIAAKAQVPPIPGGMARVGFLQQFEPAESLTTPMIFVDSAPPAASQPERYPYDRKVERGVEAIKSPVQPSQGLYTQPR